MSDPAASPESNAVISPFAPEAVGLHAALGDAVRLGRDPDLISKHLRVLREARVIERVRPPGTDGRQRYHQVPPGTLRTLPDGTREVDWQVAVARFRG